MRFLEDLDSGKYGQPESLRDLSSQLTVQSYTFLLEASSTEFNKTYSQITGTKLHPDLAMLKLEHFGGSCFNGIKSSLPHITIYISPEAMV